ncbi:MAG TPA: septum formation family protein, partial [Acidimicrobiales bacterium]
PGAYGPPPGRPGAPDPTFDAAHGEAPAPSLGYRAAGAPPAPGYSRDLPPGFLTPDQKVRHTTRQRRKGRLLKALGVLIVVVGVVATVIITAEQSKPTPVTDVEVGTCFTGELDDVDVVDCAQPHDGEVFALAGAEDPQGDFPGADALRDQAANACILELVAYYGNTADVAVQNGIEVTAAPPSETAWDDGTTDSTCIAIPAGDDPLTGSIEGAGAG